MHHNRVYPNLPHQHDIAGKFRHRRIVAHGIPAELHHHNRAFEPLQIGQGLGQHLGGGFGVLGGEGLFFHGGLRSFPPHKAFPPPCQAAIGLHIACTCHALA